MAEEVPAHARVVIVGGGIVGCSVAYHLAKLGWNDTVLLERASLSCGSTWHAAGLVAQLRSTHNLTRLARYALELYARLEAETGQATGFKQIGTVAVARSPERMVEIKRQASMARAFGVEIEIISPREAGDLWPLMRTDDLVGAAYIVRDSLTNATDTTMALARGARQNGVAICENVRVTAIHQGRGQITGVSTDQGDISCEVVVNCGGIWAREIGRMCGVHVPLHAAEHMYIVTEPIPGTPQNLPELRDADGYIYFREEVGGILMGGFEPVAKPWGMDGIPDGFAFALLKEDWDQFQVLTENALVRVPALESAGVRKLVNGPESFTPDNRFILGEAPELRNFFVAAGFNSIGIAMAAGAGKALAEWIAAGEPTMDLWDVDIRRFSRFQVNGKYLRDRTVEAVGLLFAMHWPNLQVETARPVRRSPLHDRLAGRGGCFGEVQGWEVPNWYGPAGAAPRYAYSFGRQNWFPYAAEEHQAVREAVGLFDMTSETKFILEGRDATDALQRLCANDVDVVPGRVVYTAMLNERGGIECDLTVTRLAEDRYFIVTSVRTSTHDFFWIKRHLPAGAHATLTDVTSAWAAIGVMGPRSRELLCRLTDADLSNEGFPFLTSREIHIAYATVRALRVSYVGEMGWELYIPMEFALGVYDALAGVGDDLGLRHAGFHAMDSLRCERGYRLWGHDITSEDTPLEAGLGYAVAFHKEADFIGRGALLKQREAGIKRRLVIFTMDDPGVLLFGDEPVYRDDGLMERLTSGAYGHTLGRAVGMGYVHHPEGVDAPFIESGRYEIEVAGERLPATPHLRPPYDPHGLRVRM